MILHRLFKELCLYVIVAQASTEWDREWNGMRCYFVYTVPLLSPFFALVFFFSLSKSSPTFRCVSMFSRWMLGQKASCQCGLILPVRRQSTIMSTEVSIFYFCDFAWARTHKYTQIKWQAALFLEPVSQNWGLSHLIACHFQYCATLSNCDIQKKRLTGRAE